MRVIAVQGLGVIGCAKAVVPLCAALDDPDIYVVVAALRSMSWVNVVTEDVERKVLSSLHDNRDAIQLEAVKTCGDLGLQTAVPILLNRLNPEVKAVRKIIIPALGKIEDKRALEPLQKLLDEITSRDPYHHAIEPIADTLGEIADPSSVKPLIDAMRKVIDAFYSEPEDAESEDEDECSSCKSVYRRRHNPYCEEPEDYGERFISIKNHIENSLVKLGEPVIEILFNILSNLLKEKIQTLGLTHPVSKIWRKYDTTADEAFVADIIAILWRLGPRVVEPALQMLHDGNALVRYNSCRILSSYLEEPRVENALTSAIISDMNHEVRWMALDSLASYYPCTFNSVVKAISSKHLPFAKWERFAIERIAKIAFNDLMPVLSDSDEQKRTDALAVIQQLIETTLRLVPPENLEKRPIVYPRPHQWDEYSKLPRSS